MTTFLTSSNYDGNGIDFGVRIVTVGGGRDDLSFRIIRVPRICCEIFLFNDADPAT